MPHFVIDCSPSVIALQTANTIMKEIQDTAESTGLFKPGDIKVRIRSFEYFSVDNEQTDFIHVFANIMEGRTVEQRADLSRRIVTKLKEMFPGVPVISVSVFEFERATYCNLTLI